MVKVSVRYLKRIAFIFHNVYVYLYMYVCAYKVRCLKDPKAEAIGNCESPNTHARY